MTQIQVNEASASNRRIFFDLRASDGITPVLGEAGGQPQIATNLNPTWTNTGIGTLVSVGNGRYYADLTQATVSVVWTVIEARYKSANTAECPAETVQVIPTVTAGVIKNITGSGKSVSTTTGTL